MKRMAILMALVAMLAISLIPAAMAQNNNNNNDGTRGDGFNGRGDRIDNRNDNNNNNGGGGGGISQDIESEIDETGDVDQTFTVTGGGDNSNQCVNVQGVANTGNVQSSDAFLQYASEIEDFESEDNENSLSVDPESSVTCDQQVNQATAAAG